MITDTTMGIRPTAVIRRALTDPTPSEHYAAASVHGVPAGAVLWVARWAPTAWLDDVVSMPPHERAAAVRATVYAAILFSLLLGLAVAVLGTVVVRVVYWTGIK